MSRATITLVTFVCLLLAVLVAENVAIVWNSVTHPAMTIEACPTGSGKK